MGRVPASISVLNQGLQTGQFNWAVSHSLSLLEPRSSSVSPLEDEKNELQKWTEARELLLSETLDQRVDIPQYRTALTVCLEHNFPGQRSSLGPHFALPVQQCGKFFVLLDVISPSEKIIVLNKQT